MTLFQAILSAFATTLGEILPLSTITHYQAFAQTLGWPIPETPLMATFYLGLFASLVVFFRHDFLSHISSIIKIMVYRRRPTAIDERMPFFILCALIPPALFWFFVREHLHLIQDQFVILMAVLAVASFPILFFDSYSKKNKGFYDWNIVDALCVGLGLAIGQVPGVGMVAGAYLLAMIRNYSRPGAYKFILYAYTPIAAAQAYYYGKGLEQYTFAPVEISSLVFWVTLAVSFLTGLFILTSAMQWFEQVTIKRFMVLRVLIAVLSVGAFLYLNHST